MIIVRIGEAGYQFLKLGNRFFGAVESTAEPDDLMKNRKLRLFAYLMQAAALLVSVNHPQAWAQTTEANNSSAQGPHCANMPYSMSDEQIAKLVGGSKVRATEKVPP